MSHLQTQWKQTPPRAAEGRERTLFGILLAAAGAVRIIYAIPLLPYGLFDDAYTTFRYAANLARGLGVVFNPGEHVLGTTSPLFTFILAGVGRVVGLQHMEAIAVAADILASLGMLYYMQASLSLAEVRSEVKWMYLGILAFLPSMISNATSGMETPLVLCLMSVSLYLALQERWTALACVGVLLCLARVDASIWLLALGIHILVSRKGRALRELVAPLAIFLGGVFAWLTFTKLYYGSVVPQSVVGKAVSHGAFAPPDANYALTLFSAFVPAGRLGGWGLILIGVVFLLLLFPAADLWRQKPGLRPVLYFVPLYVGIFLASRAPLFSWYLLPPKWAFYLLAAHALWYFAARSAGFAQVTLTPALILIPVGVLLLTLCANGLKEDFSGVKTSPALDVSNLIEKDLSSTGSIFLEHIGFLGFRTNRYLYDSMGLVTPATTRLQRRYGPDWLTKAAREFHADVVILYSADLPAFQSSGNADAVWFQNSYTHVADYQRPAFDVSVFFLKDSKNIAWNQVPQTSGSLLGSH
jgi:hypothetical protein